MTRRRRLPLAALLLSLATSVGCQAEEGAAPAPMSAAPAAPAAQEPLAAEKPAGSAASGAASSDQLRKVVRNAQLSIEVGDVPRAHERAVFITERSGGYLAGSDRSSANQTVESAESSTLSLKVPSQKLTAVLAELRGLAAGAVTEHVASEDVTDEVLDVDARLRNQRRLEEQLLELSKTATDVEGALKVHHELANARGEIERLEGRRKFLERQTSMASISLTLLDVPKPRVATDTIGANVSSAYRDSLAVGARIVIGGIRLAGVMVPVALLIGLPSLLALLALRKIVRRRASRRQEALAAAGA
jgi:hypothetical protein